MCRSLTPYQEAYARGVLFEKKTKRQAYRDAYPGSVNTSNEQIDKYIFRLEHRETFQKGYRKLQDDAEAQLNITRDDVLRELYNVGFCNDTKKIRTKDKLTALGMIIKMLGYEQPQKVDMSVTEQNHVVLYLPNDGREQDAAD